MAHTLESSRTQARPLCVACAARTGAVRGFALRTMGLFVCATIAVACGPQASQPVADRTPDGGVSDAHTGSDVGPVPAPAHDAGPHSQTPSSGLILHPRRGEPVDDNATPIGPALLLDGGFGGAVTQTWIRAQIARDSGVRGDVVVLSAYLGDTADGWLNAAAFASVQAISVTDAATDSDLTIAAEIVRAAEVVWLTGGDQAKYVRWKDSPLARAISLVYARGGAVGGGSAGMIVLGSSVNDATRTLSENLTTERLLANPYLDDLHFTQDLFALGPLQHTITDPHFRARDRMGRLGVFMARQVRDGFSRPDILGIGVDDGATLAIDRNFIGTRLAESAGPAVFVVRGGAPTVALANTPLEYQDLTVLKLANDTHRYDFRKRCGSGFGLSLSISGGLTPPYSTPPYDDGAAFDECATR
jgi:cyanophycinase-like exopeptidase